MGAIVKKLLPPDHEIFHINDTHSETPEFFEKGLDKTFKDVESSPNPFIITGGDMIGAIVPKDEKFFAETMGWKITPPSEAMNRITDKFMPYKEVMIGGVRGTHCRFILRRTQDDLMKEIFCKRLGCEFLSDVAKIFIEQRRNKIRYGMFTWHPDIAPPGGKQQDARKYKVTMDNFLYKHLAHEGEECCIRFFPHIHQLHILKPQPELHVVGTDYDLDAIYDEFVQWDDGRPLRRNMFYGVACGSYQKKSIPPQPKYDNNGNIIEYVPVTTYAERRGFSPNELGYAKVIVRDYKIVDVQTVVV
jgi:hypothetical protein